MVILAASGWVYTNHVARQSEQKWCDIVTTLDDSWRANPPQSAAGRRLAEQFAQLRREFRC